MFPPAALRSEHASRELPDTIAKTKLQVHADKAVGEFILLSKFLDSFFGFR